MIINPKETARLLERVRQSAWLNVESDIHPESVGLPDADKALIESALEQATHPYKWIEINPELWCMIDLTAESVVGRVTWDAWYGWTAADAEGVPLPRETDRRADLHVEKIRVEKMVEER